MGEVIELNDYKRARRRQFLKHNETRTTQFLQGFVERHLCIDYRFFNSQYLAHQAANHEMAWDYVDFREHLKDVINHEIGEILWDELQTKFWFDRRFIGRDEILEMITSHFILETLAANQ